MVLIPISDKSKLDEEDIVLITKNDALHHQKNLIRSWKPQSEVWLLRYGSGILAAFTSLSSLMINSMFRHKLKLHSNGRIFTGLSAIIGPGILVGALQEIVITDRILLYEYYCPLCLELKSSLIMNGAGLLYPLLAMPPINLAIAGNLGLRIPYLTEFREVSKFWWSVVKPGLKHITLFFVCNTIAASYITYKQVLTAENLGNILLKIAKYQNENEPLKTSQ